MPCASSRSSFSAVLSIVMVPSSSTPSGSTPRSSRLVGGEPAGACRATRGAAARRRAGRARAGAGPSRAPSTMRLSRLPHLFEGALDLGAQPPVVDREPQGAGDAVEEAHVVGEHLVVPDQGDRDAGRRRRPAAGCAGPTWPAGSPSSGSPRGIGVPAVLLVPPVDPHRGVAQGARERFGPEAAVGALAGDAHEVGDPRPHVAGVREARDEAHRDRRDRDRARSSASRRRRSSAPRR